MYYVPNVREYTSARPSSIAIARAIAVGHDDRFRSAFGYAARAFLRRARDIIVSNAVVDEAHRGRNMRSVVDERDAAARASERRASASAPRRRAWNRTRVRRRVCE